MNRKPNGEETACFLQDYAAVLQTRSDPSTVIRYKCVSCSARPVHACHSDGFNFCTKRRVAFQITASDRHSRRQRSTSLRTFTEASQDRLPSIEANIERIRNEIHSTDCLLAVLRQQVQQEIRLADAREDLKRL